MALEKTVKEMKELLNAILVDLEKSESGNKAASQRVRTGTVKLEKVAKVYRKESIHSEKSAPSKRASAAKKGKASVAAKGKGVVKNGRENKDSVKHAVKVKAKPKPKVQKALARPRPLEMKRATAKLPTRRPSV